MKYLATLSILLLAACGGDNDSPSNYEPEKTKIYYIHVTGQRGCFVDHKYSFSAYDELGNRFIIKTCRDVYHQSYIDPDGTDTLYITDSYVNYCDTPVTDIAETPKGRDIVITYCEDRAVYI